jgi:hypothetical protein
MLLLVLAALALTGPADAKAPAAVRTCAERIEAGDAPIPFPRPRTGAVFAGPLAFSGPFPRTPAALGPRGEDGRYWVKVGALVRAGRPVVLSVPARHRGTLVLHYAREEDGEPVVRIEPCPPATPAFSYDGVVGPVTAFSGGFGVSRPGCYPLDVRVVGGRTYRVRLGLGRPCS